MAKEFAFTYEEKKKLAAQTADILTQEIGLKGDAIQAVGLIPDVEEGLISIDEVERQHGASVARILRGLDRIRQLYEKNPSVESENFRNLLLSFAEDMRVILIMIADRVNLMRQIRDNENVEAKTEVSQEAAYLYAPLAHKLGLYKLKSELEDLSLKYLEHDAYYHIREKLSETKAARDAYIERFIKPVEEKVKAAGIKCHIKGRTKSIHSIWQKMKKQKCPFEGVYDLFAIRIIIDCPVEQEKMQCWQAYSIVTDMYQPNPKRLRDWLSVPKSNGYESLHITVLGPEQKWVEVQIRTERMDEIAERGVAAHWRYKGVKGETGLDEWLTNIRSMLESADGLEAMDQFKMDLYEDEVFVFTPRGDLLKFPVGATVLDFAYHIHSKVGNQCTGGRINGRVVPIRQELRSGDQVEVLTSSNQKPRQEWLNIVKTSRAKSKIRLALKETQVKEGLFAKEMLERKFKNRKIEMEEGTMFHVIKKMGFKEVSDFYKQVADGVLDTNRAEGGRPCAHGRQCGPLGLGVRAGQVSILKSQLFNLRRCAHHRPQPEGHRLSAGPLLLAHLWRQGVRLRHHQRRHQDSPLRLPQRPGAAPPLWLPHRKGQVERQGRLAVCHYPARHRQRRHRHRQQSDKHYLQGREAHPALHQHRLP